MLKNIVFAFILITSIMLIINCSGEESVEKNNIQDEKQNNSNQGVNMSNESSNLPFEMVDQNKSFISKIDNKKKYPHHLL